MSPRNRTSVVAARFLLVLLAGLSLALTFKPGDLIEIEKFFNGRATPNFLRETRNIRLVVPQGTTAEVVSLKKFPSGNYGMQVELKDGHHQGKKVWVYYNTHLKDPGIRLKSSTRQDTRQPEEAKQAETTHPTPALQTETLPSPEPSTDPSPIPSISPTPIDIADLAALNRVVRATESRDPNSVCTSCSVSASDPETPSNTLPLSDTRNRPIPYQECSEPEDSPLYEVCKERGGQKIHRFRFKSGEIGTESFRRFEFSFPDHARQDIHLKVSHSGPDLAASRSPESYLYFFPRKQIPAIQAKGKALEVTLPTGEKIVYDKAVGKIVAGAMSEKAFTIASSMASPRVSYHGHGVLLRMDGTGGRDSRLSSNTATLSKPSTAQNCKVPATLLWKRSSAVSSPVGQSDNVEALFRYPSDEAFNAFLKRRCGFGLD